MQFPDWLVWYKKPSYVDLRQFATDLTEKAGTASNPTSPRPSTEYQRRSKKSNGDIPSKLSLDRILRNRTCSPMSLYDFYMYLKYFEHSAENLEFYLWFKSYEAGRLTAFPELPKELSPIGEEQHSDTDSDRNFTKPFPEWDVMETETEDNSVFEDTQIYAQIAAALNPACGCAKTTDKTGQTTFYKRPFSRNDEKGGKADEEDPNTLTKTSSEIRDLRRAEVDTIKALFLTPASPKELNIPAPMRKKALDALATSTDAEIFRPIAEHCHLLLKSCSHRNFVRLGVSNGTFETLCMATSLGIVLTIGGFLAMLLLAFTAPALRECSRWHGIGIWPMWAVGISLILSGLRGSCFFLLLFSRRQPLPWERFDDDSSVTNKKPNRFIGLVSKLMIFDRKLKVKDDSLRRLQRKVVVQSMFWGCAFATIAVVVFLCIPMWKPL
ncbi:hypothetical protein B0J14DRAFT_204961 [Halenospora varia]|nr:hypothetical protein B0J14DRAFT_204961 [Halenospora varia]